jgi:hypothetical protein
LHQNLGRLKSQNMKPQDVEFFKINEGSYDSKTALWASDQMMLNNMTWKVQIPSGIKLGLYVMRHELIALHFGTKDIGAQFYISCLNVKITGHGTAEPPGVRFPGAYGQFDPGIKKNIYFGASRYVSRYLAQILLLNIPSNQRKKHRWSRVRQFTKVNINRPPAYLPS